jgi:SAM-dependent methyltransferase
MALNRMEAPYSAIAEAFDVIASNYDATYGPGANQVMAWMRAENLSLLQATFYPGFQLLEIGCGTGDEAIALAQHGCRVTATDISPAMVNITREKAESAGLSDRISAISLPAARLQELGPAKPFDGAYASFGSLNCEPDLAGLADALASLLSPGAFFICSFMPRFSLFETIWFMAHGRPAEAFRRRKPGWQQANIGTQGSGSVEVPVRYLSTGDLTERFSSSFELRQAISLGLVLPPPYLNELYRNYRRFWDRLVPLEHRLRGSWPWKQFGDHIVLKMQRI